MSEEKEFDLRPNGKVWFRVGTQDYLCRRPTVGDLSKILELYAAMGEKERKAYGSRKEVPASEQVKVVADLVAQWFHDALGLLTDKPMPAIAEPPAWATNPVLCTKLITHWREVPLGPSGE